MESYSAVARIVTDGKVIPDRRMRTDRRTLSWRTFVYAVLKPRRRRVRRDEEGLVVVDWHAPHLLFLSITLLLLSVADAFLTLALMQHGATEFNPLLRFVLDVQPQLFGGAKMLLTGGAILVLVVLARTRVFRVKVETLMHCSVLAYLALIVYQCWLLDQSLVS